MSLGTTALPFCVHKAPPCLPCKAEQDYFSRRQSSRSSNSNQYNATDISKATNTRTRDMVLFACLILMVAAVITGIVLTFIFPPIGAGLFLGGCLGAGITLGLLKNLK